MLFFTEPQSENMKRRKERVRQQLLYFFSPEINDVFLLSLHLKMSVTAKPKAGFFHEKGN